MRVIRFPSEEPAPVQKAWVAELDLALAGDAQGPAAESWRELRGDVRSLAPAMDPEFAVSLERELQRRGALGPTGAATGLASASPSPLPGRRRRAWLRTGSRTLLGHRRGALGGAFAVAVALVAVLVVAGGTGTGGSVHPQAATPDISPSSGAVHHKAASSHVFSPAEVPLASATAGASSGAAASRESQNPALVPATSSPAGAAAPGRVQQLGASVTLGTTAADVQGVSDQVGQLTVRLGGYVQSSNVQTQAHGASEGTLALRLPSARLGAALTAIGRLAPVRSENQSLQDITNSYNSAHQQLSDALAERQALLRALAAAATEGQIDSLRERLSQNRGAITRAQSAFNAVSRSAGTAEVEVTILGDTQPASEGLTIHRGLHDAGRVLLVTLTAILILAAVLVPLALLAAGIASGRRALRRHRRERALDAG